MNKPDRDTSLQQDIMLLVVRGSLDLLLHDNADMVEILTAAQRPDLVATINSFESSFMWLQKQLEKESA